MKTTFALLFILPLLSFLLAGCDLGGSSESPAVSNPAARKTDTTYTVMMRVFTGADHAHEAAQWRDELSTALGWKGLTVVTQDEFSVLYWGQFNSMNAAASTLAKAKAYRDQRGHPHFTNASITILPGSDTEQPEWEVHNCTGRYTLLVADFQNVPEEGYVGRMEDAVAFCRELRAKGYEAYYYHGISASSVTIGSFGPDALRTQKQVVRDPNGIERPLTVDQTVVVDPALQNLEKQFPHRLWNLREVRNKVKAPNGQVIRQAIQASLPVNVPHGNESPAPHSAGSTLSRPAGTAQPSPAAPPPPSERKGP
jgi:hypothetical protein